MTIPFSPPYIDAAVESEVLETLRSGWITTGPRVRRLEQEVTDAVGAQATLCVNSATSGLILALHWFGVGPGDEVIVPSYTYCATALAVMHVGATPVMVDVDKHFCMDVEAVKAAWSSRTRAVIPVDFAGLPCDYQALRQWLDSDTVRETFAPRNEVQTLLGRPLLLADSAHAFGAEYNGRPIGGWADLTVFSFHAVKNLTTAEGGAISIALPARFDAADVYKTLRLWALNGQTKDALAKSQAGGWRYDIVYPGFKMNMPDLLAALALGQLSSYATQILLRRREIFRQYNDAFAQLEWAECPIAKDSSRSSACHLYPLRIRGVSENHRDAMIEHISTKGVSVNVHFIPLPLLSVFRERGYRMSDYPSAYSSYSREISLPIYPQLAHEQVEQVIDAVKSAYHVIVATS